MRGIKKTTYRESSRSEKSLKEIKAKGKVDRWDPGHHQGRGKIRKRKARLKIKGLVEGP